MVTRNHSMSPRFSPLVDVPHCVRHSRNSPLARFFLPHANAISAAEVLEKKFNIALAAWIEIYSIVPNTPSGKKNAFDPPSYVGCKRKETCKGALWLHTKKEQFISIALVITAGGLKQIFSQPYTDRVSSRICDWTERPRGGFVRFTSR